MKKNIIRFVAVAVAFVIAFAAGYAVAVSAAEQPVAKAAVRTIASLFPKRDIDVSIEGETENIPHEPGGQVPSTEGSNTVPGFVIYYDTERYEMVEEDGVTYIRFNLDIDLPPCEMEIRHIADISPADAAEAARTEMLQTWPTVSEISPVEKPEGLHFSVCDGMRADSAWENVYFVSDGQNGSFRIISRYFIEAAEGHGARFAAMLQTFEVIAP